MKGNCIVGQSGGPTGVINASVAGVVQEAENHPEIEGIFGMRFGVEGLLAENVIDLGQEKSETIAGLRGTPGSALGSSRHKLKDPDFDPLLKVLKKYNIRYFFLIGGNDTMDSIHRLTEYAQKKGYEMRGIGIPKTVDNDLVGTDHCPGYPSAARYTAISVRHGIYLTRDMQKVDPISVYQTVGRDVGWLAAASAVVRGKPGDPPHIILMPERAFEKDRYLAACEEAYKRDGFVIVVTGEGITYADGTPVSSPEGVKDKFGNIEFGSTAGVSAARMLHKMATEHLGVRGEYQVPESLQMVGADRLSQSDLEQAWQVGREAVKAAVSGQSGFMITIVRKSDDPYKWTTGTIELSKVALNTKPIPAEFIAENGMDVTEKFLTYVRPLIGEIDDYARLEMIAARPARTKEKGQK